MHLNIGISQCTLHQNATLVAEKPHEQTPQKANGGKVMWTEKKGTLATKVLHEQKIIPSRVYNIQHVNLTDPLKMLQNPRNISDDELKSLENPKENSRISMKILLQIPLRFFEAYPTYKLDRFP